MANAEQKAPCFIQLVENIKKKNPFQKKVAERLVAEADDQYLEFAEGVVSRILKVVDKDDAYDYMAETYLWYTKLIRIEEMFYAKEGRYRFENYDEVYKNVYSRDDYMFDYVVGLGLTQAFWLNHYRIFRFFLDEFVPMIAEGKAGAEIGVGHGLFHSEALRGAPELHTTLLDVSNTSLATTKKMIAATGLDPERATAVNVDIQKDIPVGDNSLDVLLMGELIEHIQDGARVMAELAGKMKSSGLCYFSTAANAPAEDHILLFKTAGEIRDFIDAAGWEIVKEKLFTLNEMSVEKAEAEGHNINYCAVLKIK